MLYHTLTYDSIFHLFEQNQPLGFESLEPKFRQNAAP